MSADLYQSSCEDWIDPRSITDLIYLIHAQIGEAQRGNDTHKEFLQIGVHFYYAKFFLAEILVATVHYNKFLSLL